MSQLRFDVTGWQIGLSAIGLIALVGMLAGLFLIPYRVTETVTGEVTTRPIKLGKNNPAAFTLALRNEERRFL